MPQSFLLLIAANYAKLDVWAENVAYGLCWIGWQYSGAKLYFPSRYMIVSMIWNTYELSASHLSRATAIFIVRFCQFCLNLMFGLRTELITCANLVGGTAKQNGFSDLIL